MATPLIIYLSRSSSFPNPKHLFNISSREPSSLRRANDICASPDLQSLSVSTRNINVSGIYRCHSHRDASFYQLFRMIFPILAFRDPFDMRSPLAKFIFRYVMGWYSFDFESAEFWRERRVVMGARVPSTDYGAGLALRK